MGDGLLVLRQRGRASFISIPQGVRLGDDLVFEKRLVAFVWFPGTMRCLLVQHEKKWLFFWAGLEEFNAEISGDICAMSLDREFFAGDDKIGVVVDALSGKHNPAIKPFWVATEMPFSNHPGVVPALVEVFCYGIP